MKAYGLLLVAGLALAGCTNTQTGALIGGATGAAIGAAATNNVGGALVGGFIGTGVGAAIGTATEPPGCIRYDRFGNPYRVC